MASDKSEQKPPTTGPAPAAPPTGETSRRLAAVLIALIVIVALIAGAAYVLTVGNQQEEPRAEHSTASLSGLNYSGWSGSAKRTWAGGTYTLNVTLNQTASLAGTNTTLQVWLGVGRFGSYLAIGEAAQAANGTWSFDFTGGAQYKNLASIRLTLEASPVDYTAGFVAVEGVFGEGVADPDYAVLAAAGGAGPFVTIEGTAHATVNQTDVTVELAATNLSMAANLTHAAWLLLTGGAPFYVGALVVNETTGNGTLVWLHTYASEAEVPAITGVAVAVQNADEAPPTAMGLKAATATFESWTTE